MNEIQQLTNLELHETIVRQSELERRTTLKVLELLREVERRKLYLEKAYPSLHAYCVGELKYSDAAAQRRIQSMRLLKEVPKAAESVQSGRLTLTQLAQAQTFFVSQAKEQKTLAPVEKREVLARLEGKSSRETERALLALAPESMQIPKEKVKALTANLTKVEFVVDDEMLKKIERLKAARSHKKLNPSIKKLLEMLVDEELARLEKKQKGPELRDRSSTRCDSNITPAPESKVQPSRYIPIATRRKVFQEHGGVCQFKDQLTGRVCGSKSLVQFEHKKPFALGGNHSDSNLTLLCAQHNQLQARIVMGDRMFAR